MRFSWTTDTGTINAGGPRKRLTATGSTQPFDGGRNLGYRCPMTETMLDDDDYEEEELGPSLAMPPLYVLRTAARCPECGQLQHVYTLGCAAFHDADELRPIEQFHFLRLIRSVPRTVINLLKDRCPGYYLDQEEPGATPYLINHCQCRQRLDDDYLHGDIGAAFWPDTPDGYRRFKLLRLPIDEAIPVECSCMVGGGEELDFAKAEPW
jgi:hypothetical protein